MRGEVTMPLDQLMAMQKEAMEVKKRVQKIQDIEEALKEILLAIQNHPSGPLILKEISGEIKLSEIEYGSSGGIRIRLRDSDGLAGDRA